MFDAKYPSHTIILQEHIKATCMLNCTGIHDSYKLISVSVQRQNKGGKGGEKTIVHLCCRNTTSPIRMEIIYLKSN